MSNYVYLLQGEEQRRNALLKACLDMVGCQADCADVQLLEDEQWQQHWVSILKQVSVTAHCCLLICAELWTALTLCNLHSCTRCRKISMASILLADHRLENR